MGKAERKKGRAEVIPLFGRDEMNLIEFPFGPVTAGDTKTLEVEHPVFDKALGREVTRRLIITGSDAFGLPKPVDDRVLIGMKALTYESGFTSPKVDFSVYHLCRIIGWEPTGLRYRRLEESLDRIAGTTLKFKDAWWDKGEREWRSHTFHLVDNVELCTRDRYDRKRQKTGRRELTLSHFIWNDVIWKSFQDGFIKTLDMEMFRRIGTGRRREVPLRLFRILDKRFHQRDVTKMDLRKLCVGTVGLSPDYSPSQMIRVLDRSAKWLIECGYLRSVRYKEGREGRCLVVFTKAGGRKRIQRRVQEDSKANQKEESTAHADLEVERSWFSKFSDEELLVAEGEALDAGFGSELERTRVIDGRKEGTAVCDSGKIRRDFVRRYVETCKAKEAC